ncbi:Ubiquitin carboxyl-terminal hydrolase 14 [Vitis vinifera]|uniref:Ubiquitin carboxyl-terminal hydrolase 14 n=1 Tax=Vitis vinifera TaxID=29760 RepID=A0A438CSG7_VITVI|nr:Ubiquitin carboxyl-terminal hydrolase 14 [Vitis vinifera]
MSANHASLEMARANQAGKETKNGSSLYHLSFQNLTNDRGLAGGCIGTAAYLGLMQGHMWSGLVKDNPVERVNAGHPELDPSRSFKFGIEERLFCPSGKVAYNRRGDYILSLNIPLHEATNKDQLEAFNKLKAEKKAEGKGVSSDGLKSGDEIVRPRVPLEACLASFSAPEEVHGFYSTALKTKTTAVKTAGLTSFPDYLVLHMRKFVMEEGWVPKKLDVYIDVPDIIDISHMRSRGIQPGEELLPEAVLLWISWTRVFAYGCSSLELGNLGWQGVVDEGKVESEKLLANEEIVAQLVSMGFNHLHCQKAAINTSNAGVEEAMNWLLSHMDDPDIDFPISQEAENAEALSFVDQSKVDTLISFGFQEDISRRALRASGGDIEKATDWIFSNPDAASSSDMDATTSSTPTADAGLPDGGGS